MTTPVLDSPEGFEEPAAASLDWERYKSLAERGALTPADQMALESVSRANSTDYTRSRALLLSHSH